MIDTNNSVITWFQSTAHRYHLKPGELLERMSRIVVHDGYRQSEFTDEVLGLSAADRARLTEIGRDAGIRDTQALQLAVSHVAWAFGLVSDVFDRAIGVNPPDLLSVLFDTPEPQDEVPFSFDGSIPPD